MISASIGKEGLKWELGRNGNGWMETESFKSRWPNEASRHGVRWIQSPSF